MAIARSIESRLAEAVWTALAADADLSSLCNGRIYLGPLGPVAASLIVPPQIHVRPVPSGDGIGVGGVSNDTFRIEVAYIEPMSRTLIPLAAGATNTPPDVLAHIEKVLIIGNGTADNEASQQTRLDDPDDGTKTINDCIELFTRSEPRATTSDAGLAWILHVDYSVRQTKLRQLP